ncbi:hypothetical protein HYE67_002941 [Fusarium culmorum]|uniref:Uncharacterized protein n=1 Tax=Fusarium culmorum TaxID=5516 RepID=A0A2T4GG31_FUSCU|nr:hypothetical protein FCULG_00012620 [Fusarium culmorum]QPC60710.1 hypothetical protein HYE67_002941 [Fusarium culmorum]
MFDIISYSLLSHISHILQPLDVGGALYDFIAGGGLQITRFHFLGMWNKLHKAAFKACYIYTGWEKSGLWPVNREAVLEPLRRVAQEESEPLFLNRSHPVTPRKAKGRPNSITEKLHILSSPKRAILHDVEASLDYAIIVKSAQKDIIRL